MRCLRWAAVQPNMCANLRWASSWRALFRLDADINRYCRRNDQAPSAASANMLMTSAHGSFAGTSAATGGGGSPAPTTTRFPAASVVEK